MVLPVPARPCIPANLIAGLEDGNNQRPLILIQGRKPGIDRARRHRPQGLRVTLPCADSVNNFPLSSDGFGRRVTVGGRKRSNVVDFLQLAIDPMNRNRRLDVLQTGAALNVAKRIANDFEMFEHLRPFAQPLACKCNGGGRLTDQFVDRKFARLTLSRFRDHLRRLVAKFRGVRLMQLLEFRWRKLKLFLAAGVRGNARRFCAAQPFGFKRLANQCGALALAFQIFGRVALNLRRMILAAFDLITQSPQDRVREHSDKRPWPSIARERVHTAEENERSLASLPSY